jgi:hypothetical protein
MVSWTSKLLASMTTLVVLARACEALSSDGGSCSRQGTRWGRFRDGTCNGGHCCCRTLSTLNCSLQSEEEAATTNVDRD